jgi:hypothetical protein
MRKLYLLLLAAGALILAAQAVGAAPSVVIEEVDNTRTIPAGALCPFDFVVHSEGTRRTTTYTDQEGNLDRITFLLSSWKTTYTNPANGKTMRTVFAGPVIVEAQDDGSAIVRIPGNDGHLVLKGEGPIYSDVGLLVYVAPSVENWPERLEILHASGQYRETEVFEEVLCDAIA